MAWNQLLKCGFKDIDNQLYELFIYHTGLATTDEFDLTEDLVVEYPEAGKFDAIRGSGGTLNINSVYDRQFMFLYTNDPYKYKFAIVKNATRIYSGYLDTEEYGEPFNALTDYDVSFAFNDGFNILERIKYLNAGVPYTGIVNQWTVLTRIITQLGIDFNNLYVGISTSPPNGPAASETIFHKINVIDDNYYDEDGEPMSYREVLESILKPYGASIIQWNGDLWIYDINAIVQATSSFKRYSPYYIYISSAFRINTVGDITDIGLASTDMNYERVPAINSQKIVVSPYQVPKLFDFAAAKDFTDETGSIVASADAEYGYRQYEYNYSKALTRLIAAGQYCKAKGTGTLNLNQEEYYYKIGTTVNFNKLDRFKLSPVFIVDNYYASGYLLKVTCEAYFRTKTNFNDPDETGFANLKKASIYMNLRVGNWQVYGNVWHAANSTLTASNTLKFDFFKDYTYADSIADQWVKAKQRDFSISSNINEYMLVYGQPNFEESAPIYLEILQASLLTDAANNSVVGNVHDIRIKKVSVEIADRYGNVLSNTDLEFNGYINSLNKIEGETIELKHGSNPNIYPVNNGSLLRSSDSYPENLWARGALNGKKIEELLLTSVCSNFENPTDKLTIDLNMPTATFGYYTYNNYLSGKKLLPLSYAINYANKSVKVAAVEILADNLTLNIAP